MHKRKGNEMSGKEFEETIDYLWKKYNDDEILEFSPSETTSYILDIFYRIIQDNEDLRDVAYRTLINLNDQEDNREMTDYLLSKITDESTVLESSNHHN